jgi:dTDP-4-dehydrorhamnose 3,5-epimerase
MIFRELKIPGAFVIDAEKAVDGRGFFARTWCRQDFSDRGLETHWAQSSVSFNIQRGTLRGMHYQAAPHAESKLVRCTRGAIYDVIVDLRPNSPALLRWEAVELAEDNYRQLYIPKGVAHGFLTLADSTEVCYDITEFHRAESARGIRWNDPLLGIDWIRPVTVISDRDANYPDITPTLAQELLAC